MLLLGCESLPEGDGSPRILFIGNSITYHGADPGIGWTGTWGMAASSADKDFVHIVSSTLRARFRVVNVPWEGSYSTFDYSQLDPYLNWADAVVIEFGENVPTTSQNFPNDLAIAMAKLVRYAGQGKPTFVLSSWWPYTPVDDAMKQGAEQSGATFVPIPVYAPTTYQDLGAADPGVAIHPSDSGMKLIADTLLSAINAQRIASRRHATESIH